jgi:hypothetical protein
MGLGLLKRTWPLLVCSARGDGDEVAHIHPSS